MQQDAKKITIKQILLSNQNWWRFYEKHQISIRPAIVIAIVKLLSCKNKIRGYQEYHCSNPGCSHRKHIHHTCKSKACSSCGKKATEAWVVKQNERLPKTSWQHITFTMPSELWDFFWLNRQLFNRIGKIAAKSLQKIADKKGIILGIFIAIHTFGRSLKKNVHVHLSTTNGGLSKDLTRWISLFFDEATLMRIWRYEIINLFRKNRSKLVIPSHIKKQLNPEFTFNHFLDFLYQKHWRVKCSKPSEDPRLSLTYLSRYTKRPAIAESKLKHYDGQSVTFKYLDHKTKTYRQLNLSVDDFIRRFIWHIPDVGFRMIRYYGFLAHRLIGKLLPIVHRLLGQLIRSIPRSLTFAELMHREFNFNPLTCILCGHPLVLKTIHSGKTNIYELLKLHRDLALLKKF